MVGMEGMPSVDMGNIYKDIETSKGLAKDIKSGELNLIDSTIKELNAAKKTAVAEQKAGRPLVVTAKVIDREIASLSKMKKGIAKSGVQNVADAKMQRTELHARLSGALQLIGGDTKKLDSDMQGLKVTVNEYSGHLKSIDKELGTSLEKCMKFISNNHLMINKPQSRLQKVLGAFKKLFTASQQPRNSVTGLAQYAKQVENTTKIMESEAKKGTKANMESMNKFNKANAGVLKFVTDDKTFKSLENKIGEQKDALRELVMDKATYEKTNSKIARYEISIEHLNNANEALAKKDVATAKREFKAYYDEMKKFTSKQEGSIYDHSVGYSDKITVGLGAGFVGIASWVGLGGKAKDLVNKKAGVETREELSNREKFMQSEASQLEKLREGLSSAKQTMAELDSGNLESMQNAEMVIGSLSNRATLNKLQAEQRLHNSFEAEKGIARLDNVLRHGETIRKLVDEGKELAFSADVQGVKAWQSIMQTQIDHFDADLATEVAKFKPKKGQARTLDLTDAELKTMRK